MDSINIFIIIAIAIPLILACYTLFKMKETSETSDEFHTKGGNLTNREFLDTSLSYAYQIAAISLFAFWGFHYGFWVIWVPVFWGVGYFLLRWFNKKGYVQRFMNNSEETIHGLLSNHYRLRSIAVLAAFTSVLGMAGTAFFEAEFTANIINDTMIGGDTSFSLLLFLLFVGFALTYIILGGKNAIVKTDHLQLKIGYVGFTLFFGGIVGLVFTYGHIVTGSIIFAVSLILLVFLYFYFKKIDLDLNKDKSYHWALTLGVIGFVLGAGLSVYFFFDSNTDTKDYPLGIFFANIGFANVFVLGFPLISLLIANVCWQLIDVSSWQRMTSMRNSQDFQNNLGKALKFIGIYSPITWMFAIFLGMCIKLIAVNFGDAYNPLSELLVSFVSSGHIWQTVLVVVMVLTLILIMFSTMDSILIAISFTAQKDMMPKSHSENQKNIKWGTAILTVILLIAYLLVRTRVSGIDGILYTFYSFQLALVPSIVGALLNKSTNKFAALGSIILGIATPIVVPFLGLEPYEWTPLLTVAISTITYVLINLIYKNERTS